MLNNFKKVMKLDIDEFIKLVNSKYDTTVHYYPHNCDFEDRCYTCYQNDECNGARNNENQYNLLLVMTNNIIKYNIFVCEIEYFNNDKIEYITVVVE